MSASDSESNSSMLIKTIRWITQPLVSFLIKHGVTYSVFSDLLKKIYIDTAQKELAKSGEKPTLSRIFIQTGINRKEVKRLLEMNLEGDESQYQGATLGGLIVASWTGLPNYCDENGNPLPLPRSADVNEVGFNTLVESINKDVHARTILNEWLDQGIVTLDEQERVCLNESSFIPKTDFKHKLFFFGRNVTDHISTCIENIDGKKPAKLERSVYYSSLSKESIKILQAKANENAIHLIEYINQEALKLKRDDTEKDQEQDQEKYRMRFGCYWFDTAHQNDKEESE